MERSVDPRELPRRQITKGALWAVPAVAMSTAAPAYAASACVPTLRFSGGAVYNWGTQDVSTTTQTLDVGGQTYVDNLPAGVTVSSITYNFWTPNRIGTSSGPGFYWIGNGASNKAASCNGAAQTCSPFAFTPLSSGFSKQVTNTVNLSTQTSPNGVTYQAWDLNFSWTSQSSDTYTQGANGCRNFTTGPSGRFVVTYTGVNALSTADIAAGKKHVMGWSVVTATLSNGQVLRGRYFDPNS